MGIQCITEVSHGQLCNVKHNPEPTVNKLIPFVDHVFGHDVNPYTHFDFLLVLYNLSVKKLLTY